MPTPVTMPAQWGGGFGYYFVLPVTKHLIKIPRKKKIILAPSLRVQSTIPGKLWQRDVAAHIMTLVRKQRKMNVGSQLCFPFDTAQYPSPCRVAPLTFSMALPTSLKWFWIHLHRQIQGMFPWWFYIPLNWWSRLNITRPYFVSLILS